MLTKIKIFQGFLHRIEFFQILASTMLSISHTAKTYYYIWKTLYNIIIARFNLDLQNWYSKLHNLSNQVIMFTWALQLILPRRTMFQLFSIKSKNIMLLIPYHNLFKVVSKANPCVSPTNGSLLADTGVYYCPKPSIQWQKWQSKTAEIARQCLSFRRYGGEELSTSQNSQLLWFNPFLNQSYTINNHHHHKNLLFCCKWGGKVIEFFT